MHIEYHKTFSAHLNQDMEFKFTGMPASLSSSSRLKAAVFMTLRTLA